MTQAFMQISRKKKARTRFEERIDHLVSRMIEDLHASAEDLGLDRFEAYDLLGAFYPDLANWYKDWTDPNEEYNSHFPKESDE